MFIFINITKINSFSPEENYVMLKLRKKYIKWAKMVYGLTQTEI